MRTVRTCSLFAVALSLVWSVAAGRAHAAENPMANGWAKFGVGSSVTMSGETNAGGQKMASTMKTTLVEKGKDAVTVEIAVSMNVGGQSINTPATKQTIPTGGAAAGGAAGAGVKETGKETLTIGGKQIECKVLEVESEAGGVKSSSKIWFSDQIPGGTAKTVAKTPAGEVTYTVTAFEAK